MVLDNFVFNRNNILINHLPLSLVTRHFPVFKMDDKLINKQVEFQEDPVLNESLKLFEFVQLRDSIKNN